MAKIAFVPASLARKIAEAEMLRTALANTSAEIRVKHKQACGALFRKATDAYKAVNSYAGDGESAFIDALDDKVIAIKIKRRLDEKRLHADRAAQREMKQQSQSFA